ncbi:MAG TPA: lipoyl synthase [Candidatus Nanoarchaeia archaeon]|nr:lipoyl synthase [Candidatus Nanoarchaeia archaeon]
MIKNESSPEIPIEHYSATDRAPKPEWMRIRLPVKGEFSKMKSVLRGHGIVTVCEEAHCPNIGECWQDEGTATFMIMGDTCTRGCKFCAVKTAKIGKPIDEEEPKKVASAIAEIGLDYAVITSVDRDDLPDQSAGHFASVIAEVKRQRPETLVEVLVPDFRGDLKLVKLIIDAGPDVFAHNLETVRRLQSIVRDPRAGYEQSLCVLAGAKKLNPSQITKSSLMLGLGETEDEVVQAMKDLRAAGVDILTLGQYLQPTGKVLTVKEYVSPEKFARYKAIGESLGFRFVAAGPLVRSSYRAGELFVKNILRKIELR